MNIRRFQGTVIKQGSFAVLLVLLVLQSFGINGFAASTALPFNFQQGGSLQQALTCNSPGVPPNQPPTFCNIQIVLMIDDSGSMAASDPYHTRNVGAKNLVGLLGTNYYAPAVALIDNLKSKYPDLQYPVVQVAVIHFSKGPVSNGVQWLQIAPGSTADQSAQINKVIDTPYSGNSQLTSFTEPFDKANQLLTSPVPDGPCTHRSIMLFTDGIPQLVGGNPPKPISDQDLQLHMDTVAKTVEDIQVYQKDNKYPDVDVYITGFNSSAGWADQEWNRVEPSWRKIAVPLSGSDTPNHVTKFTPLSTKPNDKLFLAQLASHMVAITAKLASLQSEEYPTTSTTTVPLEVPKHVQILTFIFYNLNANATLVITGPDNQIIKANGNEVTESKSTGIDKWELKNPISGSYQISATAGGIITELLTYQNLNVEFNSDLSKLQQSVQSDIKFRLTDDSGNAVLPTDNPKLDLKVSVTLNGQTTPLSSTLSGDMYQVSWTPHDAGKGQLNIEANLIDDNGTNLLNCSGTASLQVTTLITITPTATPTPAKVSPPALVLDAAVPACVLPGKTITVPVRLLYEGNDRSWVNSVHWDPVIAKSIPDGKDLQANISTVNADSGDYQVTISPSDAKELQLTVAGNAEINGQTVNFSGNKTISICATPVPPIPIVLIFIWILMWLVILLLGWVVIRDRKITIHFQILIALELIIAVIWFIFFSDYRIYLFWMLLLLTALLVFLFLVYLKEIEKLIKWWLIILVTLFVSIWFMIIGDFSYWLILLLLLMWLGILVVIWVYLQTDPPQIPWLILLALLILFVVSLIYFSTYWIFLLLWLLVTLVLITVIHLIGPICPPIKGLPIEPDDLKLIEGIGPVNEEILNEHGIYTFEQLAYANGQEINKWFDEAKSKGYKLPFTRPYSWPYQAWLVDRAQKTGKPVDWEEFEDAKNELKGGVNRDDYDQPEKSTKNPRPKRKKPEGGKSGQLSTRQKKSDGGGRRSRKRKEDDE